MILPPDLLRVRRTKYAITPLYAEGDKLGLAKTLIAVYRDNKDRRRGELNEGLASCEELGYDFRLVRGLSSVLDSRCVFGTRSFITPVKARGLLFGEAARVGVSSEADRAGVLTTIATQLGVSPEELDQSIYADLEEEQQLTDFREPAPAELLGLYNLALLGCLLTYSVHIAAECSGKSEAVERAAEALGEAKVRRTTTTIVDIVLKPTRMVGIRGARVEALLQGLLSARNWRLSADVAYPPRYSETRPLEANNKTHSGILRAEPRSEEIVIEIKAPVRKGSFGDLVIIDDVANRLGLTDKELLRRIEAEKVRYVRLPGVLVTPKKLESLRKALSDIKGHDLTEYKATLREQGCKNPMPVLEALGYFVDTDPETGKPYVSKLGRPRTP